jgi:transcriptional regulator with XRE-family HTH domain
MNSDQLRMARALLRLGIRELAEIAGVGPSSIQRLEAGRKPHAATAAKLRAALEERGVVFLPALSPYYGAGVALRHGVPSPVTDEEDGVDTDAADASNPEIRGWEETEFSAALVEAMARHWSDSDRWQALSEPSRQALLERMRRAPKARLKG